MSELPIASYPPKSLAEVFLDADETRRRVSILLRFSGQFGEIKRLSRGEAFPENPASSRNTISIAFVGDENRPRMLLHCRGRAALSRHDRIDSREGEEPKIRRS